MRTKLIVLALALSVAWASSASADTFGTGANSFTIDFVHIGNPGNVADTTGTPNPAGAVPYTFQIGKYEISRGTIAAANAAGGLGLALFDMSGLGGNGANQPATGLSWPEMAKFVNWLNSSTGHAPAYKFDAQGDFQLWTPGDLGYNASNQYRNSLAKYVLPSNDEWYKAAFYNPANGTYYDFATGSNSTPIPTTGGTVAGTVVYGVTPFTLGPAQVHLAGGLSPYGTMGQSGNVGEWMESMTPPLLGGPNTNNDPNRQRVIRGGGFLLPLTSASVGYLSANPSILQSGPASSFPGYSDVGFRVVSLIPEPSSAMICAAGTVVVGAWRSRTKRRQLAMQG
jgi:formylglycine-generating enzyme required for sulfatase activity